MVDPTQPNPYRTPAFGPADHDLMIPAGHVVLVLGVLLLLTPITMLVHGLVQGLWVSDVPSHSTILTEVLLSVGPHHRVFSGWIEPKI